MFSILARLAPLLLLFSLVVSSCRPQTIIPPPRPEIIETPDPVEAEDDERVDPEADVPIIEEEVDDPDLEDDPILGDDDEEEYEEDEDEEVPVPPLP